MMTASAELPVSVQAMLNGDDLVEKVGHTFLFVTCERGGWPRMAMLSVGEVLATSATEVRLALYPTSGTTRALIDSGRGLLVVVLDGITYKIRLDAKPVEPDKGGSDVLFVGKVSEVDEDVVGYASVEHGIVFSLVDEQAAVDRWIRTIERLKRLGQ